MARFQVSRHVSSLSFIFALLRFPVTPPPPLATRFPSPAMLTNTDNQNLFSLFNKRGGKQLNYSNDPGPGTCLSLPWPDWTCCGASGCGLLASPGCQSCVGASSCGSKVQIFSPVVVKQLFPFTFVHCFDICSFSEVINRIFVCDWNKMELRGAFSENWPFK